MSELLRLLVSLSLSGGVLTLLTGLLNRLLRGRMPVRFLYALWLLALLRFLCPVGTDGSLAHRAVTQPQAAVVLIVPGPTDLPVENGTPEAGIKADPSGAGALPLPALLTAAWAAGVLTAAGRRWGGYVRLKRRLRREELPVAEWELALLGALTEGDRRAPRLKRSAVADAPMLVGLFRPVIWLPAGAWGKTELGYALRHELVHGRRHDLLFKWAAVGTACLHWFNPAVWYLVRAVERDGELSCDEAVVRMLSQTERTGYGELLLRCAMGQASRAGRLAASLNTQKQDLKARLTIIMRKQPDPKKARRLLAAVVVLLVTVSASVGAYAISAEPAGAHTDVQSTDAGEPIIGHIEHLTGYEVAEPIIGHIEGLTGYEVMSDGLPDLPEQTDAAQADGTDDAERPELPSREFDDTPAEFPLAWPIETEGQTIPVSALYGGRAHPVTGEVTMHNGIDIVLSQDTPVLAAAAGTVTESGFDATLGNYVVLEHSDGLSTLYAHMTGDAMPEVGDPVEAGEQIGAVGATGASTGFHLHFEVRVDGSRVDPLNYLPCVIDAAGFGTPET